MFAKRSRTNFENSSVYVKLFPKNWIFTNRIRRRILAKTIIANELFVDTNFENLIIID